MLGEVRFWRIFVDARHCKLKKKRRKEGVYVSRTANAAKMRVERREYVTAYMTWHLKVKKIASEELTYPHNENVAYRMKTKCKKKKKTAMLTHTKYAMHKQKK